MGLKTLGLSIVIGSVFSGAKAFASSSYAVTKLEASVKKLNDHRTTLKVDTKEFAVALKKTQLLNEAITKLKTNSKALDDISAGRDKFKSQLVDNIALGTTAAVPVKLAADFETAMAGVRKVVDFKNDGEFKKMGSDILKMSTYMPVSAEGLAQIAANMGGIGLAAKDILPATKAVGIMSTAFDMSAEDAGQSMGRLMNVYSLTIKQVNAVGDTINALDAATAAKARSTVEVLGRIGGSAKIMGLSEHSAAGLAAAFLDLGVAPEVAGTGINALLGKMMTADKQGEKFQKGLSEIGYSAEGLKKAVSKDATGALNDFLHSIAKVDKAKRMGVLTDLFGAEYADDIALVVGGIDRYDRAMKVASQTTKNAGSMQREFEIQSATTNNKLQKLKNGYMVLGVNIGTILLPALNSIVSPLSLVSSKLSELAENGHPLIKTTIIVTAGIIGATIALSLFGYAASFVKAGLIRLSTAYIWASLQIKSFALWVQVGGIRLFIKSVFTKIATAATWLYSTALKAGRLSLMLFGGAAQFAGRAILWMGRALLMNPIGLAITAIAGGAYLIYRNWEPIKGWFSGLWNGIKSVALSSWGVIKTLFGWTPLGMVINNWTPIKSFFADMVNSIGKWFGNLFGWFDRKIQSVGSVIAKVKGLFGSDEKTTYVKALRPVAVPIAQSISVPNASRQPVQNKNVPVRQNGKPHIPSIPSRSSTTSNNVTVNISNPNFANKEHAAATQKQIDEQVRKALARQKNDKNDRSYS